MVRIPTTPGRRNVLIDLVDKYDTKITRKYTIKADTWLASFSDELAAGRKRDIRDALTNAAEEIDALIAFCQKLGAHAEEIGDKGSSNYSKLINEWVQRREDKWKGLGTNVGTSLKKALNATKKAILGV